jgi:hypothetical protein
MVERIANPSVVVISETSVTSRKIRHLLNRIRSALVMSFPHRSATKSVKKHQIIIFTVLHKVMMNQVHSSSFE